MHSFLEVLEGESLPWLLQLPEKYRCDDTGSTQLLLDKLPILRSDEEPKFHLHPLFPFAMKPNIFTEHRYLWGRGAILPTSRADHQLHAQRGARRPVAGP